VICRSRFRLGFDAHWMRLYLKTSFSKAQDCAFAAVDRASVCLQGPGCCTRSLGLLVVLAPSSCAGCSPAAFAVGVAASRAPPAAACGRASSPPPVRMPLQARRSLRAAFQKVYVAVRRTSPASAPIYLPCPPEIPPQTPHHLVAPCSSKKCSQEHRGLPRGASLVTESIRVLRSTPNSGPPGRLRRSTR
jgi:hypothetical protein